MKHISIIVFLVVLLSACCKTGDSSYWYIENNTEEEILFLIDSVMIDEFELSGRTTDSLIIMANTKQVLFSNNYMLSDTLNYAYPFGGDYIDFTISVSNGYELSKALDKTENWQYIKFNTHSETCHMTHECTFTINESDLVKTDTIK